MKLMIKLPQQLPSNSISGYFFKETKNTNSKRHMQKKKKDMHIYVHSSIIHNN